MCQRQRQMLAIKLRTESIQRTSTTNDVWTNDDMVCRRPTIVRFCSLAICHGGAALRRGVDKG